MDSAKAAASAGIVVVISVAAAQAVRVTVTPAASSPLLSLAFPTLCALTIGLGYVLRRIRAGVLPDLLLLLGNLLVPLSLYDWALAWGPAVLGRPEAAASFVLAIGIVYHAAVEKFVHPRPLPEWAYPYLIVGHIAALLALAPAAAGLPRSLAPWLILAVSGSLGFGWAVARTSPRAGHHLVTAALTAWAAALAAAVLDGVGLRTLGATYTGAALALALTFAGNSLGATARAAGVLAWGLLTAAFTATLYVLGAPLVVYLAATTLWVITLTCLGRLALEPRFEALRESAPWLAVGLGLGLSLGLLPGARDLLGLGPAVAWRGLSWSTALGDGRGLALAFCFTGVGCALLLSTFWQGRYPTIAFSKAGFVATAALYRITAYSGPILLALGASLASSMAGPLALSLIPAAVGVGFVLASLPASSVYPRAPLDAAGVAALPLALWNARGDKSVLAALLGVSASIFLWRSIKEAPFWPHVAFLTSALVAGVVLSGPGILGLLPLGFLPIALLVSTRVLVPVVASERKGRATVGAALVAAAAAIVWDSLRLSAVPLASLIIWAGLLIARPRGAGSGHVSAWDHHLDWARVLLGHLAGGTVLVLWLRPWERGRAWPVVLMLWSWLHFGWSEALRRRHASVAVASATYHASHVLAAATLVLGMAWADAATWAAVALAYAALCFESAAARPLVAFGLRGSAHSLIVLSLGIALWAGLAPTLVALLGAALVFLWRSVRDDSSAAHLAFLVLTSLATAVATLHSRSTLLPLATLAIVILLVGRWLEVLSHQPLKVALTRGWALALAACAVPTAWLLASDRTAVFLTLWLGTLAGGVAWRQPEGPAREAHRKLLRGAHWLLHAAGISLVLSAAADLGVRPELQAPLLVAWALLHLAAERRLVPPSALVPAEAVRHAVLGTAVLSLVLAAFRWNAAWSVAACVAAAALFFFAGRLWGLSRLRHATAWALIEGAWLTGTALGATLFEAYLLPVATYLALLARGRGRATESTDAVRRVLASTAVALGVALPLLALAARPTSSGHALFLAGGSLVLSWAFGGHRRDRAFLLLTCAAFVLGVLVSVGLGQPEPVLSLALVGAAVLLMGSLGLQARGEEST